MDFIEISVEWIEKPEPRCAYYERCDLRDKGYVDKTFEERFCIGSFEACPYYKSLKSGEQSSQGIELIIDDEIMAELGKANP